MRGIGKTSNVEIARSFGTVAVVSNSCLARVDGYADPREALEAPGVRD
jgi:hypothetical protein